MTPPLRIAYLVQQFPPEVGAGPARVTEMGRQWLRSGSALTVITAMPNRPEGRIHAAYRGQLTATESWEGIRVLRSWLYASPKHGFLRTVLNNLTWMVTGGAHALVRMGRADVLIASSPPFFPHLAGVVVSRLRGVPLVLEIRDLWPDYLVDMGVLSGAPARALFALERWLLRRAAAVVVVTESFRRRVVEKGVAAERVHVISNGVDLDFYRPADEPPPLPALARRGQEFLVGYLGNIGAGQALTTVVEAAARLMVSRPDIRFVLAGDGPDRNAVEAAARERGLTNLPVHPPIPKSATRAFYNACDLVLVPLAPLPVFQETVPSKLFEILACERPVLASLAGEAAAIVAASGGGMSVPPGRPELLAQGIERFAALSVGERAAMGVAGRRYVAAQFSRDVLADRYLAVLRSAARVSG
ncbi:MAG TPA: glycosyltransferase family 4 protein [Gemmatimonadales bacterium]|nr:glycosyltransferase family 4 protein [Gemmatimonadales bacterium]